MAMGKAVVSTTIGAEGLPVTSGRHLVVADDPRPFADAVVDLMRDVDRRREIESAARALVVEHYDWSAVAGELESALERFALRPAQGERHTSFPSRAEPVEARVTGQLS